MAARHCLMLSPVVRPRHPRVSLGQHQPLEACSPPLNPLSLLQPPLEAPSLMQSRLKEAINFSTVALNLLRGDFSPSVRSLRPALFLDPHRQEVYLERPQQLAPPLCSEGRRFSLQEVSAHPKRKKRRQEPTRRTTSWKQKKRPRCTQMRRKSRSSRPSGKRSRRAPSRRSSM